MDDRQILTDAGRAVKARIIGRGVKLGELARRAGIRQTSLSQHIHGRRRNLIVQVRVWRAYCRLTGERVTLSEFWGPLARRVA